MIVNEKNPIAHNNIPSMMMKIIPKNEENMPTRAYADWKLLIFFLKPL